MCCARLFCLVRGLALLAWAALSLFLGLLPSDSVAKLRQMRDVLNPPPLTSAAAPAPSPPCALSKSMKPWKYIYIKNRFYSNLITKNIAMGGDVETSANSAFTTGSKRHAITDEYEMQEGNPRKATVKAQNSLADANVENNENSDAGNGGSDPDAPSARMVDPRAATGAGALGESGTSAAEITPTEQEARRKASLGKKEAAVGETAGADDGALVENFGAGSVRRRQENTSTVGMEGSARVADDAGDVLGRVGKRARSERVGGDGEEAGERERGSDRQRGQNEGGDEMEKGGEESAATAGLSGEERKAAEEVERVQRVAAAKARKEAAVKAARERFLARKGR